MTGHIYPVIRLSWSGIRWSWTASMIRWQRGEDLHGNALTFAEQWEKNQCHESEALQDDGNGDGALLDAAGALFRLRIAFDEATAERTEFVFGWTGHTLGIESHHTPPENFLRAVGICGASLRRLRSGNQRRSRRDVRC